MKKLKDEVTLIGKIETVSITDFRVRPGDTLAQVELGKTFVLTRCGRPVAVLSSLPGQTLAMNVASNGVVSYTL